LKGHRLGTEPGFIFHDDDVAVRLDHKRAGG
jgi:hypothetical protein